MRLDLLSRGDVILPGKVLPGGALASRGDRIAGILEPGVQADTGDSLEKVGQVREQAHVDVGFTRPSPRWTGWKPSLTGRRAGALPFKTGCTKPTPALLGRDGYRESVQREADQAVVAAQRPKLDYALAVAPLDSAHQGRVIDAVLAGHACKC